jgi:hypothetical protein
MKKVLAFILVVLVVVSFKEPPKKRYFFVGYNAAEVQGNMSIISEDGYFIKYGETVKSIKDDTPEIEEDEKVTITGIYEFKSKAEMEYFYSDYSKRKHSDH